MGTQNRPPFHRSILQVIRDDLFHLSIDLLSSIIKDPAKREKVTKRYRQNLADVKGITILQPQKDVKPNHAYFPIVVDEKEFGTDRQAIYDRLRENDIYTRKYFYPLTSDMDCYRGRFDSSLTPVAKQIAERVLTLPMSAHLTEEDVDRICDIIKDCRGAIN